jgi:hypothetical protein
MKEKNKKILTIIWKVAGVLSLANFIFWFVKVRILNQYGMVSDVLRLTISTSILVIYLLVTGIFLLIKYKKKHKK